MRHGLTGHPLYSRWNNMKSRCHNPNNPSYKDYGARGITVCDEWRNDFKAFYDWSMANGYQDDLTIDRTDNDRGYSPDNCRWVTMEVQCTNRRDYDHNAALVKRMRTNKEKGLPIGYSWGTYRKAQSKAMKEVSHA